MNTIWIALIISHGWFTAHIEVKAYATEVECQRAANEAEKRGDVGRCESAEAMLKENQK